MDHTIVNFEIAADQPERAAQFYRDLFGWEISKWEGSADQREGFEYWTVRTVPTDETGMPTRPRWGGRGRPGASTRARRRSAGGRRNARCSSWS